MRRVSGLGLKEGTGASGPCWERRDWGRVGTCHCSVCAGHNQSPGFLTQCCPWTPRASRGLRSQHSRSSALNSYRFGHQLLASPHPSSAPLNAHAPACWGQSGGTGPCPRAKQSPWGAKQDHPVEARAGPRHHREAGAGFRRGLRGRESQVLEQRRRQGDCDQPAAGPPPQSQVPAHAAHTPAQAKPRAPGPRPA